MAESRSVEPCSISRLADELRRLRDLHGDAERDLLREVMPLARRAAMDPGYRRDELYDADPGQGFGTHVLHAEPDDSLFVVTVSWLPGRGAPPHDHGTWGVIVAVDGPEHNTFWERSDDRSVPGRAELRRGTERLLQPGEVLAMPTGLIHSVRNDTERTTLSFHVYGCNLNQAVRSQYDPERGTEGPFPIRLL